jgi:chemotaxis protein MotB
VSTVSYAVGERTELVDTGRHGPKRRPPLVWSLLAILGAAAAITGWVLWEQGRLARDEVAAVSARLEDANQRAAAAEDQIIALSADRLRSPADSSDPDLEVLADALRGAIDGGSGEVAIEAGTIVVTLDDPKLFRGDDAELTRHGDALVEAVASVLSTAGDRTVWVRGHIDDAPLPDDAPFDSAWELSSARALTVLRALAAGGVDARRLAAVAFGAERPAGNDRAKNRRIEIVVEPLATAAAAKRSPTRSR